MVVNAHARNRYDEAKAIESQLQSDYGYSLQMKAGGPDPLADFLFNVKTGHCEYFSTAMAVMLRTRGIASRVVNGFLPGEYNEAAGAYTVRQSDAHSWVEVYFPESRTWVTFDPTPAAGRTEPVSTGLTAQLGKYAEALELSGFNTWWATTSRSNDRWRFAAVTLVLVPSLVNPNGFQCAEQHLDALPDDCGNHVDYCVDDFAFARWQASAPIGLAARLEFFAGPISKRNCQR